jgi:ribA/ribD-fused uncharacterized protein
VEHAYQAAKTLDMAERGRIASLLKPGDAKRAGSSLQLREGWEGMRLEVMGELVKQKFAKHEDLRRRLLGTDECVLQEGNRWGDRFWGVDLDTGEGENHLGRILMKIREELQKE